MKTNKQTTEKLFKFGKATEKELTSFQKLIKESITSFNNLEDLACLIDGKFSKENKFALNSSSYLNQIKVKIIIDFLDVLKISRIIANGITEDFLKFHKLICNVCKNFLLNREIIFRDSAIFVNLIILNYPFYASELSKKEFFSLQKTDEKKGKLIGFNQASVLAVKNPIYRLWSKKCFYTCDCNVDKKFTVKYASIFKPDNFNNLSFYETACKQCKKPFHTDKNSELFIEAQEIILLLPTPGNTFLNNKISLWLYGEMINSIKEGERISFLSFYANYKSSSFQQKDFSLGNFVALNINIYFEEMKLLKNVFLNFDLIRGNDATNNNNNLEVNKNARNLYDRHFKISHAARDLNALNNNNKSFMDFLDEKEQSFISQDLNNPNNQKIKDNFNINNEKKQIINENNYNNNLNKVNFNARFNENSEINILRSISFGKQISSAFFNLIYVMYLSHLEKVFISKIKSDSESNLYLKRNIDNNFSMFDGINFNFKNLNENILSAKAEKTNSDSLTAATKFNFYIQLACKLSITQREYFTKLKQYFYLNNCQQNIETHNRKNKNFMNNNNDNKYNEESNTSNIKGSSYTSNILSRSVIFKTKIFENKEKEKINEDYKKYFKFARQGLNEYNNSCDLLMKPLNLLFIFDEISVENLSEIFSLMKHYNLNSSYQQQAKSESGRNFSYQDLIVVYPYFFPNKFQKESIITFLKSNNNKIILIPDVDILTKFELEILSSILINNFNQDVSFNTNKQMEYNITFWFVCSYKKLSLREKKNNNNVNKIGFQDNKFKSIELFVKNSEIILNLSETFNKSRGYDAEYFEDFYKNKKQNYMDIVDNNSANNSGQKVLNKNNRTVVNNRGGNDSKEEITNLANELLKKLKLKKIDLDYEPIKEVFGKENNNSTRIISSTISDFDFSCLLTQKNISFVSILKNNICNDYHYFNKNVNRDFNNKYDGSCELNEFNDSFSSSKLLEDYFLIKRNINRVDFNDIVIFFSFSQNYILLKYNSLFIFKKTLVFFITSDLILIDFERKRIQ